MKKLIVLFALLLISQFSNCQNQSIGFSYGHIYSGWTTDYAELVGASSHHFKNGNQFNINYKYQLSDNFNIISGLQFQQTAMQSQNGSTTGELQSWDYQVENLNVPVLANLSFLKYLFVEGGFMLNFQINDEDPYGIEDQSGIGVSLGAGAQYSIGKFNLFIKTQGQMQALIPFNKENYHDRLVTNSLSAGFFYKL